MIWLAAGDARTYDATFTVLHGAKALAAAETRITAAAQQPDTDYPAPTGHFPQLTGRTAA